MRFARTPGPRAGQQCLNFRKVRPRRTPDAFQRGADDGRRPGETKRNREASMKAKLLSDAGGISEGTVVEIASKAGTNDTRSDKEVGGRSTTEAPVYEVTDTQGHAEKVDTRDLKPKP